MVEELTFLREVYPSPAEANHLASRTLDCVAALNRGEIAPLTAKELEVGARIAWRNHARCIGRLHWRSLKVRDRRHVAEPHQVWEELLDHLALADEGGAIRPVITIFSPHANSGKAPRIWNRQLIGYAGYRRGPDQVLGDPANLAFTDVALAMGWSPPASPTAFDLLPVIISDPRGKPHLFRLPPEVAREVQILHPSYPWFAELGLRWYAVPMVTDMRLHLAGSDFYAAPFNGWYMGTEIGVRDLADAHRYNVLPQIAARLGLDTRNLRSLWQERALVELNLAVLQSFTAAGVRIVDHHTAAEEFMCFAAREKQAGREVSARWDWIVPPLAPSNTPVFHLPMIEYARTPDFHSQMPPEWQIERSP